MNPASEAYKALFGDPQALTPDQQAILDAIPERAALSQVTRPTSGQAEGVRPLIGDDGGHYNGPANEQGDIARALSPVDRSQPVVGALTDERIKDLYRQAQWNWGGKGDVDAFFLKFARDLLAASAPALQAGWVAVPREPTQEMIAAGKATGAGPGWLAAHEAMLSAAPSQAGAGEGTAPRSLLRAPLKPGDRLVCYCPPGVCQAPKGFSGPCNRASENGNA